MFHHRLERFALIYKDEWIPASNIRTALISLQALCSPEPGKLYKDNPQDAMVAGQYKIIYKNSKKLLENGLLLMPETFLLFKMKKSETAE